MFGGGDSGDIITVLLIVLIILILWKLMGPRETFLAKGQEIGPRELRAELYPQ